MVPGTPGQGPQWRCEVSPATLALPTLCSPAFTSLWGNLLGDSGQGLRIQSRQVGLPGTEQGGECVRTDKPKISGTNKASERLRVRPTARDSPTGENESQGSKDL